jgi:prepilin-type N-terminal cleavage/methylation domain-containing protein
MRSRRAFTLLELIVSIAIAGIIALLVYGSASAGLDTRDALDRYRTGSESEMRSRTLLADALRHATDETDGGGDAFVLVDATDARGIPEDRLSFVTRGVTAPLGASDRWHVSLEPTPAGLLIRAVPLGDTGVETSGAAMTAVLPDVRGVDVQVSSLADPSWSPTWTSGAQLPDAVRIGMFDANGAPAGVPIVVRIGLEVLR